MHDVISAFLDNEPFDARELADALATPDGRDLLIDVIAMRALVQVPHDVPVRPAASRPVRPLLYAAAAVLVASVAGYSLGRQSEPAASPVPDATSVFTFEPGVNWTESSGEGGN